MKEIALHIMDIVQNSITARASEIQIHIRESAKNNNLSLVIEDNGSGISKEMIKRVMDPYTTSRTTRKVGMGLSLLKHHAELTGGRISIHSEPGSGTKLNVVFIRDHIDIQPMGDLPGVLKLLLAANPEIDFIFSYTTDSGEYTFSSAEAKEILEVKDFNNFYLLEQLKALIIENLEEIGAG
jgi:anti-sigma regulatory factor (Ser/Thr protein kinase)